MESQHATASCEMEAVKSWDSGTFEIRKVSGFLVFCSFVFANVHVQETPRNQRDTLHEKTDLPSFATEVNM